jgi:hypothetical protein
MIGLAEGPRSCLEWVGYGFKRLGVESVSNEHAILVGHWVSDTSGALGCVRLSSCDLAAGGG